MRFATLVETSVTVAATSARTAKRDALADLLRHLEPREIPPAVGMLTGEIRQGRIGVGWATVRSLDRTAALSPTLDVLEVDRLLSDVAAAVGPGSVARRRELLDSAFARATDPEQQHLARLLTGELRQGSQEGTMLDAVAAAAGVPATAVRRAFMLSGDLGVTAVAALSGGRSALDKIGLSVLTPIRPMLASTAEGVGSALADAAEGRPVAVEWKLDGARIQVHRDHDEVAIFTRNLNDVTSRLPGVVQLIRSFPARRLVLDGEILGVSDTGEVIDEPNPEVEVEAVVAEEHSETTVPGAFQDTISQFSRRTTPAADEPAQRLRPWFFDVLHLDGDDLIHHPLAVRRAVLGTTVGAHRIPGIVTADPAQAQQFLDRTVAAGHEGVMVKDLAGTYVAGRRGKGWRKIKPVHTVDLVVLAAEWGHGRRRGWLSNLHLGARNPADANRFVMVGKTFKGLTDDLLTWQTAELQAREIGRETGGDTHVVHVRPELVVEVAVDGVQGSVRYPGGVALRFARVRRYRPDKAPDDATTLEELRTLLPVGRRT